MSSISNGNNNNNNCREKKKNKLKQNQIYSLNIKQHGNCIIAICPYLRNIYVPRIAKILLLFFNTFTH